MLQKMKRFGLDVSRASKQVGKKLSANPKTNLVPAQANSAEALKLAPHSKQGAFAIVAIGASAGGLEAFTQLLRALPASTGMAFVFLQHLDPKHHSILPELLAKSTAMPVEEAKHGTKASPDHIYVIPPNVNIAISNHALIPLQTLSDKYRGEVYGDSVRCERFAQKPRRHPTPPWHSRCKRMRTSK